MVRRILALLLTLVLLAPAVAIGESAPMPFGLKYGMNAEQVRAAFAADATLSALTPDKSEDGQGMTEYLFENVKIPGTDITATSLTVQIDRNNSKHEERLTGINVTIEPGEQSVATFRKGLLLLTAALGQPDNDPFDAGATESYVEWGMLDASWTFDDSRIGLSLNRMFEESITLQCTSRLNYDATDLTE